MTPTLTLTLPQAMLLYAALLELVGGSEALGSARRALVALRDDSKFLLHIYVDLRAVLLGKLVRGTLRGLQAHGHVSPSAGKANTQVCYDGPRPTWIDPQCALFLLLDSGQVGGLSTIYSLTHYARTSQQSVVVQSCALFASRNGAH